MAVYKVWLTVKDDYGNTKEVDGGTIDVALLSFSPEEIKDAVPLEDYLKKSDIDVELERYATDAEVDVAVKNTGSIKYSDFEFTERGLK